LGACGTTPAWKSNAAPTPISTGADSRSRIAAIHFSCFGTPRPTHTTSAPEASMSSATACVSLSVSGRKGGQWRPAIHSPGCRRTSSRSSSASDSSSRPP
jgi:hypothetical protein